MFEILLHILVLTTLPFATLTIQPHESYEPPICTDNEHTCHSKPNTTPSNYTFPGCNLYLANSTFPNHPNLGVFHVSPLARGHPVAHSDIVIQLIDTHSIPSKYQHGLDSLVSYTWSGESTGGHYEGTHVLSIVPGIGFLANGASNTSNIIPWKTDIDEAQVSRSKHATAGSFTHYMNTTFYAMRELKHSGMELLVDSNSHTKSSQSDPTTTSYRRDPKWLQQHGTCLDNLTIKLSTLPHAGRGAFATRTIPKNAIVAPLPMIPITNRQCLELPNKQQQLLLNYCYGHEHSNVLLFPTAPGVNLINHAPSSYRISTSLLHNPLNITANVRLQWSQHNPKSQTLPLDQLTNVTVTQPTILLEYVAIRHIHPNEEIVFDYGISWETAYSHHLQNWKPVRLAETYTPAYVMEDVAGIIRTENEQLQHPYDTYLRTTCFYQYAVRNAEDERNRKLHENDTTTLRWNMTRNIFDYHYLRPCQILQRDTHPTRSTSDSDAQSQVFYTVRMRNRPSMELQEQIPKQYYHIVTHVPRMAIRFVNREYTTDQHLGNAFRKEIGFPEELFPKQWMNG